MVSIIIPIRYRADLTKVCIDSVLQYTSYPYELILVQEGKDEEIKKLLLSYNVKYIQNEVPKGFAGAHNTGMTLATGTHYCFMNNDVVVTPMWLENIMKGFTHTTDLNVGLVSPLFTEIIDRGNDGKEFEYVENPLEFKGVCFVIPKEVIDEVGKWDESYGLGGGDDNDICTRIKQVGYNLVFAKKSYIYHYGSASFREEFNNDVGYSKRYAVQQFNKFREKHNIKDKPSVFIAVPCGTGFVHCELAMRLLEWSHDANIRVGIKYYPYLAPLDNARNRAVKDFLEDYYDYLLFVDDDIAPPMNTLYELLLADKDVIAPLCFCWKTDDSGQGFPSPVAHRYNENKEYKPYIGAGVEETDTITGGMFLVKREVYEKMERPFAFTYHKNGLVIYSEDFYFSQQAQKIGYKLYTHFGLLCKHYKSVDLREINNLMVMKNNG
jgi:GT2 family glycosyltransferase